MAGPEVTKVFDKVGVFDGGGGCVIGVLPQKKNKHPYTCQMLHSESYLDF